MVEARGVGHEYGWRIGGQGRGGQQRCGTRGRNGLHVLILVRGRPRAGAEA